MFMDPGARQYILEVHLNSAWVLECLLGSLSLLQSEVSEDLQPSRMRGERLDASSLMRVTRNSERCTRKPIARKLEDVQSRNGSLQSEAPNAFHLVIPAAVRTTLLTESTHLHINVESCHG